MPSSSIVSTTYLPAAIDKAIAGYRERYTGSPVTIAVADDPMAQPESPPPASPVILNPADPLTSSRAFVARSYVVDGHMALRHHAGVRPVCPEGERFCGVVVWKADLPQFARAL